MHLMDVVIAYLYGSLDNEIYMKIPEGLKIPKAYNSKPREMYSFRLQRLLYGLKQSGCMWYNHLSEYLSKKGYTNNAIFPYVFIKKIISGFVILAIYIDDINLIATPMELHRAIDYLKNEFEMKDLEKTILCLALQIEHLTNGIFCSSICIPEKVLKRFYVDEAHPLSTPVVVRSLDVNKDPFRPQ